MTPTVQTRTVRLEAIWIAALLPLLGCVDNPAILEANNTPRAEAGEPRKVDYTGTPVDVLLDGSASTDTDGTLFAFRWLSATAMPDGSPGRYVPPGEASDWPADSPQVTVRLPEGTWKFSLQVTDNIGATSLPDVVTIEVSPPGAGGAAGMGAAQ